MASQGGGWQDLAVGLQAGVSLVEAVEWKEVEYPKTQAFPQLEPVRGRLHRL